MRRAVGSIFTILAIVAFITNAATRPVNAENYDYDSTIAGLTKLAVDSVSGADVPVGWRVQPTDTESGHGTLGIMADSEPVTTEQFRAVTELVPATYVRAEVFRDGNGFIVFALYKGGEQGLLVVRGVELSSSIAVPTLLHTLGAAATGWAAPTGQMMNGVVVAGNGSVVYTGTHLETTNRGEGDEGDCNCTLARVAAALYVGSCAGVAVAVGTTNPPAGAAAGVACGVSGSAVSQLADEYCDTCRGTRGVTLTPAKALGYQTQDRPVTTWEVCYSGPDGFRVGLTTTAPSNSLTTPHNAQNNCGWFVAEFSCCIYETRIYPVTGWVEFPAGDWGYANGTVKVYYAGY